MKATREPSFTPVILTLESQAEVDAIHTLLNFAPTVDSINKAYRIELSHKTLLPFMTNSVQESRLDKFKLYLQNALSL